VLAEEKPDLLTSFFLQLGQKLQQHQQKNRAVEKAADKHMEIMSLHVFCHCKSRRSPKYKKRKEEVNPNQEATARRPRCSGRQRWLSGGNWSSQPVESRDQR